MSGPTDEFWRMAGFALLAFALMGGFALITWAGG